MRFRWVTTDQEDCLRLVNVIVRVGHRTITPSIRDARYRSRVADSSLVVNVVRAPVRSKFAVEV